MKEVIIFIICVVLLVLFLWYFISTTNKIANNLPEQPNNESPFKHLPKSKTIVKDDSVGVVYILPVSGAIRIAKHLYLIKDTGSMIVRRADIKSHEK